MLSNHPDGLREKLRNGFREPRQTDRAAVEAGDPAPECAGSLCYAYAAYARFLVSQPSTSETVSSTESDCLP